MKRSKKRTAGRPPLPEGHAKASVLALRLTNDERAAIEAAAAQGGIALAQWARDALVAAAKRSTG